MVISGATGPAIAYYHHNYGHGLTGWPGLVVLVVVVVLVAVQWLRRRNS